MQRLYVQKKILYGEYKVRLARFDFVVCKENMRILLCIFPGSCICMNVNE